MNKYTFICERYNEYKASENERVLIDILAESEADAHETLSSYKISHGQLHYARMIKCEINVSPDTECRKIPKDNRGMALFVACLGAAISSSQMYNPHENVYMKALQDKKVQRMILECQEATE